MPTARGSQTPWGNQTRVLTPEEAEAGGYVMGPAGYYLDEVGNLAPNQVTPGMRDNPQGQTLYDPDKDLNYFLVNGRKVYQSPYDPESGGYRQSLNGPPITDTGGGLVHGMPKWNPMTGEWDVNLDWGKVMSWAVAGGLTAGVLSAAMAGGAGAGAAGGAGGGATAGGAGGGAAAGGVLPSTVVGSGYTGGIAGGTGLGAGAAGGTVGVGGGTTLGALTGEGALPSIPTTTIGTASTLPGAVVPSATLPPAALGAAAVSGAPAIPTTTIGTASTLPGATIPSTTGVVGGASTLSKIAQIGKGAKGVSEGLGRAATAQANNEYINELLKLKAADTNITGQSNYIADVARLANLGLEANSQNLQALAMHDKQLLDRQTLGLEANQQNLAGLNYYDQALLARGNQGLAANAQNIQGEDAYRNQLLGMATEEDKQRADAYRNVGRASLLQNAQSSPFNPRPSTAMSADLASTLSNLSSQGTSRLASGAQYDTRNLPAPKAYQPYTPTTPAATPYTPYTVNVPPPTPYTPYSVGPLPTPTPYTPYVPGQVAGGTLNTIANYAGPGIDTLGTLLELWGKSRG